MPSPGHVGDHHPVGVAGHPGRRPPGRPHRAQVQGPPATPAPAPVIAGPRPQTAATAVPSPSPRTDREHELALAGLESKPSMTVFSIPSRARQRLVHARRSPAHDFRSSTAQKPRQGTACAPRRRAQPTHTKITRARLGTTAAQLTVESARLPGGYPSSRHYCRAATRRVGTTAGLRSVESAVVPGGALSSGALPPRADRHGTDRRQRNRSGGEVPRAPSWPRPATPCGSRWRRRARRPSWRSRPSPAPSPSWPRAPSREDSSCATVSAARARASGLERRHSLVLDAADRLLDLADAPLELLDAVAGDLPRRRPNRSAMSRKASLAASGRRSPATAPRPRRAASP